MLTQETVKELFDYVDGDLIRKTNLPGPSRVGDVVGSINTAGYSFTRIKGASFLMHRVIWLWHYGYIPENMLDHIDRNQLNNRIENLREVTQVCNMRNSKDRANNTSGVKGVWWEKINKEWRASIGVNSKNVYLGRTSDFVEAVAHRLAGEQAENWDSCDQESPARKYMDKYLEAVK